MEPNVVLTWSNVAFNTLLIVTLMYFVWQIRRDFSSSDASKIIRDHMEELKVSFKEHVSSINNEIIDVKSLIKEVTKSVVILEEKDEDDKCKDDTNTK